MIWPVLLTLCVPDGVVVTVPETIQGIVPCVVVTVVMLAPPQLLHEIAPETGTAWPPAVPWIGRPFVVLTWSGPPTACP